MIQRAILALIGAAVEDLSSGTEITVSVKLKVVTGGAGWAFS